MKELLHTLGMDALLSSAQELPATLTKTVGTHAENLRVLLDAAQTLQTLWQDPSALAPQALSRISETAVHALHDSPATARKSMRAVGETAQHPTPGLNAGAVGEAAASGGTLDGILGTF